MKVVIDTNVILDSPEVLLREDIEVVLPYTVVSELDKLKRDPDLRASVQKAFRIIKDLNSKGKVTFVDIPKEATTNDEKIVKVAKESNSTLWTNDIGASIIASSLGVATQDFISEEIDQTYVGYREIFPLDESINNLVGINELMKDEAEHYFGTSLQINEYVYYKLPSSSEKYAIWRLLNTGKVVLVKQTMKPYHAAGVMIEPQDIVQMCALDAIFSTDTALTIIEGKVGTGKAQPLDSIIHTPDGPKTMRDIEVGSYVIGSQGTPVKVTGVYPQGQREAFRVTLQDGSSTLCCEDHLWTVFSGTSWKTLPLKEMLNNYKRPLSDKRYDSTQTNYKYRLPTVLPVQYNPIPVPIDSYLLGCLLGDGTLGNSSISFTSEDEFIWEKIKSKLPENVIPKDTNSKITKRLTSPKGAPNYLLEQIQKMGLNTGSNLKRIPNIYKYNSLDVRLSLLQGLMDTDGCVNRDGSIEYTSVSKQLILDIQQIVRSLGGKATLSSRYPTFSYLGEKKTGQLAFRLYINMQNSPVKIFSLPKKVERLTISRSSTQSISNIEYVGKMEMQCISVDAEDCLYVTDDYIVTHNTILTMCAALARTKGQHNLQTYQKILVTRAPLPIDKSLRLGYLPGNSDEKMSPWLSGVKSNLKFLYERTKKDAENGEASKVFEEFFEAINLESIQGLNIHGSILIVDEYQLLSADMLKQILSRAASGAKIILVGDPQGQVYGANRGVEGFKKLQPWLKNCDDLVYIRLQNIYRSKLTEFVEKIFS